jgi:hypothetical protein
MKKFVVLFMFLTVTSVTLAIIMSPFTSWTDLEKRSPDIVFARCTTTPEPQVIVDGMITSEIEVQAVLKGATKPGTNLMVSEYLPHQGEHFLIFSTYSDQGIFKAYTAPEAYRIVPVDRYFGTNNLAGKTLDEKIQLVLQRRLDDLKRERERADEEIKRLETGLKK